MDALLIIQNERYIIINSNKLQWNGKYRSGEPVGLPYLGSKKKVAKKLVEIIKQNFGEDKIIYDIFGGGGAITAECIINNLKVVYNDVDEDTGKMFLKVINSDEDYIKSIMISRDEFIKIRDSENKTVDDKLKILVNSFGNKTRQYLYGRDKAEFKYNAGVEILEKEGTWKNYKRSKTYKEISERYSYSDEFEQLARLQQLENLQQLQGLQQLERLQQLQGLQQLEVSSKHYREFSDVEGAILYLDPPYEGAEGKYSYRVINYKRFYDWCVEMSKKNIVLISSYIISDDRFECVYVFDKARSTIGSGQHSSIDKTEKLFMVKGWEKWKNTI